MSEITSLRSRVTSRSAAMKRDPIFGGRSRHELMFLPAALEIVETPAPPVARLTILVLTSLLMAGIAWACLGKVDIISAAPGKLIPSGGGKIVQPLETGTVTAIAAYDGQHVSMGQPLIQLEPTETQADRDRLRGELAAAQLNAARLRTLALHVNFTSPQGVEPTAASISRRQANAERAELEAKVSAIDHQIEQYRAEIAESQAEARRLSALLPIERQSTGVFLTLEKKGYGSKLQLLQAQEKAEDTAHQLEVQEQKVPELEAQISAAERQRTETIEENIKTNLGDLSEARVKAASLSQQLSSAEAHLRTRTLTAPVDGTVQELAIHTIGGVVEPGQTLMRIAPMSVGVELEAKLPNKDIGFVRSGMPVAVKVETFPFTRYCVLHGVVTSVSNDAVSDKRPDGSEELTYLLRVRLDHDTMDVDGHTVRLTPGMAVTAEVKTGRRRIIQYIFSPIAKAVREAGHER